MALFIQFNSFMKSGFGLFKKSKHCGQNSKPWLNLGCGACFHPDWVNVDFAPRDHNVIRHDLRRPLPFADANFEVVYHSHVLEHFSRAFAPVFLKECHRVLKPGGIVRVVVPDLETMIRLYLQNLEAALAGDKDAAQRYEWMIVELLDQMVRETNGGEVAKFWAQKPLPAKEFVIQRAGHEVVRFLDAQSSSNKPEKTSRRASPSAAQIANFREAGEIHKWMYDRYSLRVLLEKTGFTDCQTCVANESRIPNFNSYLLDLNQDGSVRKPDSFFMEATKP
jgi:predicted SAM-dependent methyltransferase